MAALTPQLTDKPVAPTTEPHNVVFVAWPGLQMLDLAGPFEVFNAANRVAGELGRSGSRYRQLVISASTAEIVSESGLRLSVDSPDEVPDRIDTLVLPGGDGVHDAAADPRTVDLVRRLAADAGRIGTVCTGTFLAAAAGLLDGARVATHWARADRLRRQYPDLDVDGEALYIKSDRIWSSAGVTAGMDLALAMVESDHDAEVAQISARWLVVHLRRPGGQSQFAAPVWTTPSEVEPIRRAQERVHADPGAPHTVADLAATVGLSTRHFSRLFTAEVGESPARFVDRVRVDAARRELETGSGGVASVAMRCGFGTTETMRRAFQRRLGLAPDEYRRRFQLS